MKIFNTLASEASAIPISKSLLEDMNIRQFLLEFFPNPESLIVCDEAIIDERNKLSIALLQNPKLATALEEFYHNCHNMLQATTAKDQDPLHIINSMATLNTFYNCAWAVIKTIEATPQLPTAFETIMGFVKNLLATQLPPNFTTAWESFASGVERPLSTTYKINFSSDLRLTTIALKSINKESYTEKGIFSRISKSKNPMEIQHLLSLSPGAYDDRSLKSAGNKFGDTTSQLRFAKTANEIVATQAGILKLQISTLERNLTTQMRSFLTDLQLLMGLYNCAKAIGGTFAKICPMESHTLTIQNMAHPMLTSAIKNNLSNNGEIILLGGENQSGKTTFLRTVGVVQILFQMGLPVPGTDASISPASGIFSVFSREEDNSLNHGKLGNEFQELSQVIHSIDSNGLFLGNEPITGTSPKENLLLSKEALCILKSKGLRGIWVSHIPGLFKDVQMLNSIPFGSMFVTGQCNQGVFYAGIFTKA